MAARPREVSLRHQDEREVVLRACQRDPIPEHLEQRDRPGCVPGREFDRTSLVIGHAEPAVHARNPPQVENRTAHLDRLLVRGDGPIPLPIGDQDAGEDAEQASLGRSRHRFQGATDRQSFFRKLQCVFRLRGVRQGRLRTDAFGEHHAIVDRLKVRPRFREEGRGSLRLRRSQARLGQEKANAPEAECGGAALEE